MDDRLFRQQIQVAQMLVRLCAEADEKFEPVPGRLYMGRMVDVGKPLNVVSCVERYLASKFVFIETAAAQKIKSAVVPETEGVAEGRIRFIHKAAGDDAVVQIAV